jgi:hypothetical protein
MRSGFCCMVRAMMVLIDAHVLVKKPKHVVIVCDKVPVGVFVYAQQERKKI